MRRWGLSEVVGLLLLAAGVLLIPVAVIAGLSTFDEEDSALNTFLFGAPSVLLTGLGVWLMFRRRGS